MNPQDAIHRLLALKWTGAQIAAAIGVSTASISRIRNGLMQPTYPAGVALVEMAKRGRKPPRRAA